MRASQFVFVEVAADHALWLVEAQWVQSLADAGTAPVGGIVAGAPPGFGVPGADMTQLAADLDALAALPLARGIRASGLNFSDPSTFGTVVSHVALLASRGLSVDLITPVGAPGVGAAIARLAEALPVATFVLDHVGSPGADPAAFADWAAGIALVGTAPNVYVKLGGILQYFKSSGVFPTAAQTSPFVTTTLAAFGWGRVMFEGNWFFADWPGAGGLDVYNRWIPLLEAALGSVSPAPTQDNIDAFFAGNARKAYRLAAQRL